MDDIFQLSIELYDTKESKVIWSDRWQESWDNLPTIKMNLSDGLLKALDTTSKVERKVETANTEAYEYYLQGKYKYEKRENMEDTELARRLLNKAIELDDNLLAAKVIMGISYSENGDNDRATKIFTSAMKQAEKLGDIFGKGIIFSNIAIIYDLKGDYDKAMEHHRMALNIFEELFDKSRAGKVLLHIGILNLHKGDIDNALIYFNRSLSIQKGLGDEQGMLAPFSNIAILYSKKFEYDKALDYYNRAVAIAERYGNKLALGNIINSIGHIYTYRGSYDKSLEYYNQSLTFRKDIGNKLGEGHSLTSLGAIYDIQGNYDKALKYFNRSLAIYIEIDNYAGMEMTFYNISQTYYNKCDYSKSAEYMDKSFALHKTLDTRADLEEVVVCSLIYKNLGEEYDEKEIHKLIKEAEGIHYYGNYNLYQLLEDKNYLETAYSQIQELANNLEPDVAAKFLSYPIPKAIVKEWEKNN